MSKQFARNLQRFRLVTFDVTDTLLRFRRAPAVQYAKTAAEFGLTDIDQQRLETCFRREFKSMAHKYPNFGSCTPNMSWQQWWIDLVENIFRCVDPKIPEKQLRTLAERLLTIYRTRECWSHICGSKELLQKVQATGKYVGVISNFDASLPQVLHEMGIADVFDFVVTSYEAKAQKPNAEIFNIPLDRCKIRPTEALHIGNIYEIDYVGARNSGWSSLLIAKDPNDVQKAHMTHAYASITDLINALETKNIQW